jgi:hypothetical protein
MEKERERMPAKSKSSQSTDVPTPRSSSLSKVTKSTKKGESTVTTRMLAKEPVEKELDKAVKSHVSDLIQIHTCSASHTRLPRSTCFYINSEHLAIFPQYIGDWSDAINKKQCTLAEPPSRLLKRIQNYAESLEKKLKAATISAHAGMLNSHTVNQYYYGSSGPQSAVQSDSGGADIAKAETLFAGATAPSNPVISLEKGDASLRLIRYIRWHANLSPSKAGLFQEA